ncbi:hypothetical protein [Ketobacter sp.]|uniref:hypothetical protein n=1 Tax=Ketobacter sp. TaxID=2083498 RepID=UPI000F17F84B|nr:hypothetical protein [Ketobacter sp.]RLU01543.1 MAG: hypothetical protein D9N14_01910 [Ketobacter sp.]
MQISLFFFGNPDRGDDAVGEALYQWAQHYFTQPDKLAAGIELRQVLDFQLEPEHIFDLEGSALGIFVDCHAASEKAVTWQAVPVGSQLMFSSHSLTAESLLFLYENTLQQPAPPCYLLGIRGEDFSLGKAMSPATQKALELAKLQLAHRLRQADFA